MTEFSDGGGDGGAVLSAAKARWTLGITILASSVAFIDMTIVNLALPIMQRDLGATFQDMQWVVEAYILLLTALTLTGGGLADAFGRRKLLCIGAFVFLVASVMAGLATSTPMLIAARVLQGVGGAMLAPASLAIVSSSFPPEQRGRALGQWAAFSGVSTAIAPALGGILIELWSWRAVFFVNVPLLLAVLWLAPRRLTETRRVRDVVRGAGKQVDWAGGLSAIAALAPLTYALLRAGQQGLGDPGVIAGLVMAVFMFAVFLRVEQRAAAPMVPLQLFRSRSFAGLNLMTLVIFTAVGGVMFMVPMVLIYSFGYSPAQTGAAVIPSMLAMFVLAPRVGRYADRAGPRLPLTIGPLISAAAYLLFSQTTSPDYLSGVLAPIVLMGVGFGIWVTPLTSSVMSAAGERNAGIASGINNAIARLAQLLAIACLGIIATVVFNGAIDIELSAMGLPAQALGLLEEQRELLGAMSVPDGFPAEYALALESSVRVAFREAFAAVCLVCAALCCIAAALGRWSVASLAR